MNNYDEFPAEERMMRKSSVFFLIWGILTAVLADVALVLAIWRLLL